jgi:putative transposase
VVTPSCRRDVVTHLQTAYKVSERRACRAMSFSRASQRYASVATPQDELRQRLKELAQTRVRYGYRRLHVLLRREGWTVNAKRIYRLYKLEGLVIRPKTPKRKRSSRYRGERPEISAPNETWAMDFMSDTLFDGRRYRVLTIVDCHSRESLAIEPRQSFGAFHVVQALDRIARERGVPKTIRCDNGPEFSGRVLDQWAFYNQVQLDFSRPATPTDNAFIESFNASVRKELLNASWFTTMAEARARMVAWRKEYNEDRPHSSLQDRTPKEYADDHRRRAPSVRSQTGRSGIHPGRAIARLASQVV